MVTNLAGGNKRTLAVLKKSENDEGEAEPRGLSSESNSLNEIQFSKSTTKQENKIIISEDSSGIKQSYKNFCQNDKVPNIPKSESSGGARSSNCKGE